MHQYSLVIDLDQMLASQASPSRQAAPALISINAYLCVCNSMNRTDETENNKMPLDHGKFCRKKAGARQAMLIAMEWSAIIFAGMLAVLFLGWALASHPLPLSTVIEHANDIAGGNHSTLVFRF